MATQEERREATKRSLLAASSAGFRSKGFAGVGVDGISHAAGATSGAFYAHLGSKRKAFFMALELGLDEVIEAVPQFQAENGDAWVQAFVDYYLGAAHRRDLACGCAMTSLSPEVVRADEATRALYEEKMGQVVALIAQGLDGGDLKALKDRAWSFLSVLIGGLTVCRGLESEELVESVSEAVAKAAVAVAAGG